MAGKGRSKKDQHLMDTQEPGEGGENILAASLAIAQGHENWSDMMIKRDEENEERRLKAQYEAEERAEQRRLKAEIAAEERAELRRERAEIAAEERREKAKIAEEERQEARALQKDKRRQEEALRAEEASRELMAAQAELGRRASEAHRLEVEKAKVISGLSTLQKDEDVEDFLLAQERKLRAGGIPEAEWAAQIGSKLTGQVGNNWQERRDDGLDYQSLRVACLKGCGYTPDLAGDEFFSFRYENLKGLAGEQVYKKGAQLLKRMVAPTVLDPEAVFKIVKRWVYNCVGRRARAVLEAREIEGVEALARGLQDFLSHEGEKVPGKAAVFGGDHSNPRKQNHHSDPDRRKAGNAGSSGSSNYQGVGKCFKCGKPGHKAADCWGSAGKPVEGSNKMVCYICGIEGHKATTCPNKKEAQKGAKQVKRVETVENLDNLVEGRVNGRRAKLLLDSGAQITVVPENLVGEELRTGGYVRVKGVLTSGVMPLAKVEFEVEGMEKWVEKVALAPAEEGKEDEVLYGLKLQSPRGLHLISLITKPEEVEVAVGRVTTRAEAKKEEAERQENAKLVEVEKPKVQAVVTECRKEVEAEVETAEVPSPSPVRQQEEVTVVTECRKEVETEVETAEVPSPSPVRQQEEVSDESTGEGEPAADRPAGNPEPVPLRIETVEEVSLEDDVEYCLRKSCDSEDLQIPPVRGGPGSRVELVEEVKTDPSLKGYRRLADKGEQGFLWERELLYQAKVSEGGEVYHALVLPQGFRKKVLEMAHEGAGHLGARKVKTLISQRFTWPGMGVDAIKHTRSCEVCQRCSKSKSRKVPLMERQVMSEPFEVLAFDLVGPFPPAKYGYRYVLTAICMGSKWPEAIPLKTQTAKAVASGMIEVFSRTGIPLQLLSDQGSQFLGSLVTHLCRDLRIDKLKTAPYHPECNGVVERMHGTLGPMLTKASKMGLDWVEQLPFAMFALRSAPNKDTGFSPYQLVYGHRVRTPLDVLHQGWAELEFCELETEEWSDWLVDKLSVWHDLVRERGKKASSDRKTLYDKSTINRTLDDGDLVMCRIPGLIGKLEESWHGPYKVVSKKSRVDYLVDLGKGKGRLKVLHINNLKRYHPRVEEVLRLALVAEDWSEDEEVGTKLIGRVEGFNEQEVVEQLRGEFPEVFSDLPGKTTACKLNINTGDAAPRRSHPYRVPNKLKEGVRAEVEKLVDMGIVVPSTSPWASPVVPVPKGDGSVSVHRLSKTK